MQSLSHSERKISVDGTILNLLLLKPISLPVTLSNPSRLRRGLETQKILWQRLPRELPTPPLFLLHHVANINVARDTESVLGFAEHVLVVVVPHANEDVVRVKQVAAGIEGDAGCVVQLEH
jgi:hypothetical protein